MKKSFHYLFCGNHISREKFLDDFREKIESHFLRQSNIGLIMFFTEIVKNIYDHADGKGEAIFSTKHDLIQFSIKDYGTESFDMKKIKEAGSLKTGNGLNYGLGISQGMIEKMAQDLGISLRINTSCGFSFFGVYQTKTD